MFGITAIPTVNSPRAFNVGYHTAEKVFKKTTDVWARGASVACPCISETGPWRTGVTKNMVTADTRLTTNIWRFMPQVLNMPMKSPPTPRKTPRAATCHWWPWMRHEMLCKGLRGVYGTTDIYIIYSTLGFLTGRTIYPHESILLGVFLSTPVQNHHAPLSTSLHSGSWSDSPPIHRAALFLNCTVLKSKAATCVITRVTVRTPVKRSRN